MGAGWRLSNAHFHLLHGGDRKTGGQTSWWGMDSSQEYDVVPARMTSQSERRTRRGLMCTCRSVMFCGELVNTGQQRLSTSQHTSAMPTPARRWIGIVRNGLVAWRCPSVAQCRSVSNDYSRGVRRLRKCRCNYFICSEAGACVHSRLNAHFWGSISGWVER